MLKQYSSAHIVKINAKTLEHAGPCSVLGAGHYPSTEVCVCGGGGMAPISDFIYLFIYL